MKKLFILIFILANISIRAQAQYTDTVFQYFDENWKEVKNKKDYFCYFRIARKTDDNQWHVRDYCRDTRKLQSEGIFLDDSMTIKDGKWYYYYYNGTLEKECTFNRNNLVGLYRSYSIDGKLTDSTRYKSTGIPFLKSFHWDEEDRLVRLGEYDMKGTGEGYETEFYEDSTVSSFGKYTAGYGYIKDSIWSYYHRNGKLSLTETYDSGKLTGYTCYNPEGVEITTGCDTATKLPEPGYDVYRFLGEHTIMPNLAKEMLFGQFTLTIDFIIDIDGTIKNAHIDVGSFDFFNEEALRVARSFPKWKQPGKMKNRALKTYYTLPFTFRIE